VSCLLEGVAEGGALKDTKFIANGSCNNKNRLRKMAFLQRTIGAVRQGVLAHLRVSPTLPSDAVAPVSLQFLRGFAEASYLDKSEVTDRVLSVVKNFEKVDDGKVGDPLFVGRENSIFVWASQPALLKYAAVDASYDGHGAFVPMVHSC
jgi:hypothetical protein